MVIAGVYEDVFVFFVNDVDGVNEPFRDLGEWVELVVIGIGK